MDNKRKEKKNLNFLQFIAKNPLPHTWLTEEVMHGKTLMPSDGLLTLAHDCN